MMYSGASLGGQLSCDKEIEMHVRSRQWRYVAATLQLKGSRITANVKRQVIEQASELVRDEDSLREILVFADDNQLENLLKTMIDRRKWSVIPELLKRNITPQVRYWAIAKVCTCAMDWETHDGVFERVLTYVDDSHLDNLLVQVVSAQNWAAVPFILRLNVSVLSRTRAVEAACRFAVTEEGYTYFKTKSLLGEILLHADVSYLENFLTIFVAKQKWRLVPAVLKRQVSAESRRWVVQEAFKQASNFEKICRDSQSLTYNHALLEIFSHADDDQVKNLLEHLIEREKWNLLPKLLQQHISENLQRWAVERCSVLGNGMKNLIDYCAEDQVDSLLQNLAARCEWEEVRDMLASPLGTKVSSSCRKQILEEAARTASEDSLSCLIQFYKGSEGRSFLFHLIKRQFGSLVQSFIIHCEEKGLLQTTLSQADCDQLDSLVKLLVTEKRWRFIGAILRENISVPVRKWATDHLQDLLKQAVADRNWDTVSHILSLNVIGPMKKWAAEEARCYAMTLTEDNLGSFDDPSLRKILSHASVSELEDFLTDLVLQKKWFFVSTVLSLKSVRTPVRRWAVREACKNTRETGLREPFRLSTYYKEDHQLIEILSHADEDQLEDLLKELVSRGHWRIVPTLLKQNICSNELQRWVVEQCSTRGHGMWNLMKYCADDQVDTVLNNLAERAGWREIIQLLSSEKGRKVTDHCRKLVFEKAGRSATGHELVFLLQFCKGNEGDCLLFHLVKRELWFDLPDFLEYFENNYVYPYRYRTDLALPGLSYYCVKWAIIQMCTQARFLPYRLSQLRITEDFTDTILEILVRQGQWNDVHSMLMNLGTRTKMITQKSDVSPAVCNGQNLGRIAHDNIMWIMNQAFKASEEDTLSTCSLFGFCPERHIFCFIFKAAQKNLKLLEELIGVLFYPFIKTGLGTVLKYTAVELVNKDRRTTTDGLNVVMQEILSFLQKQSMNEPCVETKEMFVRRLVDTLEKCRSVTEISADDLGMFMSRYLTVKPRKDKLLFEITSCLPWSIVAQNIAVSFNFNFLKKMKHPDYRHLRSAKIDWFNTLGFACLTYLWEQNRRDLFQTAVKQKRWKVVKRWADHTLYDDQRWWALEEAYKDLQGKRESLPEAQKKGIQDQSYRSICKAILFLADHGLTEEEQMLVHNRLGKFADWDTILDMFEHGADVREVREMLQAAMGKRREEKNRIVFKYSFRISSLWSLEQDLLSADEPFGTILARNNWRAVLHTLRRSSDEQQFHQALHQATERNLWHVVLQLVRLGMNRKQRDTLFVEMLQLRQWGVMRELLEKGVSIHLCLNALPELLRRKQWMLVARIMDYDVDDSLRREVMEHAMEQREGSLVWHCMAALKTSLSVEKRVIMFEKAFTENNWQAVKALVEIKDETGIQQRDEALQEAIQQHRWDVVDHCQRHHAGIDMKDKHNETALHRHSRHKDWKGVVELVCRSADQRLLDKNGLSVLHKALDTTHKHKTACDEDIKKLIQFHAPLNQPDPKGHTPLQSLIEQDKGELIDLALWWSPDLHKGVTEEGKTALHAACASGCWQSMYYLIQRGVDPLAVASGTKTLLHFAVRRNDDAQRTLAECIGLGLSTCQPEVSDRSRCTSLSLHDGSFHEDSQGENNNYYLFDSYCIASATTLIQSDTTSAHSTFHYESMSPAEYAVLKGKRVILHMLYESGACSSRELFKINNDLISVAFSTSHDRIVATKQQIRKELETRRKRKMQPFIEKMATMPRSLQSTCRLVISHSLNVRGRRHRDVARLPVLDEEMKEYVMFKDLTDPGYGKDMLKWEKEQSELEAREEKRLQELHGMAEDS